MNVASLELCKELFELSRWDDTHMAWSNYRYSPKGHAYDHWSISHGRRAAAGFVPAYDLGFLIQKLPMQIEPLHLGLWRAYWEDGEDSTRHTYAADDTPEDAACKLAIELFKQGILTKEAA